MTNYLTLPTGRDVPNVLHAVIEIPKGSSNKYEYDKDLNVFKLDRTLYSPVHYPGAYGFIPQTHGEDGDPLDVVVIVDQPTFTGCLIEVRPLGVLIMRDDMGLDHKILAVPVSDPKMREVHGLQHLPSHYLAEVDYFFNIYKDLEGKKSDTYGWEDRLVAYQVINDAVLRYEDLKAGRIDRWGVPVPGRSKGMKSRASVIKQGVSNLEAQAQAHDRILQRNALADKSASRTLVGVKGKIKPSSKPSSKPKAKAKPKAKPKAKSKKNS